MNKEEIIEYNKKCAEFLGWKYFSFEQVRGTRVMVGWEDVFYKGKTEELKFHSDWNWIMEVLTKISSLDFGWKITSKYVNIYSHAGDPRGEFDCVFKTNCPENVMLDVVRTINQFLIWYNDETRTNNRRTQ